MVVFDGLSHAPLMAMEGMRERTVKIGSAGKIFSLTGWKVGFVCAAPAILRSLARAHQFITFTTPPNLQEAVAYGLTKDDAYFAAMRAGLQRSRDRFASGLTERRLLYGVSERGNLFSQHRYRAAWAKRRCRLLQRSSSSATASPPFRSSAFYAEATDP